MSYEHFVSKKIKTWADYSKHIRENYSKELVRELIRSYWYRN